MPRIKRPLFLFFELEEKSSLDLGAFLRGSIEISTQSRIVASPVLGESQEAISRAEFRLLTSLSAKSWSPVSDLANDSLTDVRELRELVAKGLLLDDSDDPAAVRMREQEQELLSTNWHPVAALYHFLGRRLDRLGVETKPIDLAALANSASEDAEAFIARHGDPPSAFHQISNRQGRLALPISEKKGGLYQALVNRSTARAFDSSRPLKLGDLSTLLRYVFGCLGTAQLSKLELLHKTSPSGGSLHPCEAYPLLLNVDGADPGLYHYDVSQHSLEVIRGLDSGKAQDLAAAFGDGQEYMRSAHALIIVAARFPRNQWKYRRQSRTYGVILMDIGHLSQTFYLVAAELGLGAFFSAAVDGPKIEDELGLDGSQEGALAICGCGIKPKEGSGLGLDFEPFIPRGHGARVREGT